MANKIIFGADLIKVLEKEYKLNKLGEVPTKYKNGVTTIDFIYGKEKNIDDLKYNKPYVEFSIDDETDGFISGTMYLNGGVEGIQFDSLEDLKYFMKNAKWTESRKSLKEGIDVKIVYADDTPSEYIDDVTHNDILDIIEESPEVYKIFDVSGSKKKLVWSDEYGFERAYESKKSARKSIKESKVDFQSVIDKVLPKEYANNKNAYKFALSCVTSLYNEDEYDSDNAKVYFLNCYISDLFPSWVDELGEEEMDALANGLYDGLMKWKDIDSSWFESKKSARKSMKESKASLHEDNIEYGVERIRNKVKGSDVTYYFDDEDCFIDVTEKNGNLWAFTIDFGSGYVYMIEPKEDRGSFGTDNEAFDVIISMLQGKRFNE